MASQSDDVLRLYKAVNDLTKKVDELTDKITKQDKDIELLKKAAVGAVNTISSITNTANEVAQAIGAIQDLLEPIIENVGSLLGFLGDS